jgi:NAD(P)H-hydrate epimerase
MGRADEATIRSGTPAEVLMERAGHAVARAVLSLSGHRYGVRVVVICGKGNNGGDGFVVARLLRREGAGVRVLTLFDPSEAKGAAAHHLQLARDAGVRVGPFTPDFLDRCDVIVDAIFGTGFRGSAEGDAARAIEAMNNSGAKVVAVDIPSGVDGATGAVAGDAVRADVTVTMQFEKIGTAVGAGYAGKVQAADIGIGLDAVQPSIAFLEPGDVEQWLPERPFDSHKRSSGSVAVLAGSNEMRGAALLTVRGAQRMGSGYVTLGTTGLVKTALASSSPEALAVEVTDSDVLGPKALDVFSDVLEKADALAIGPGIGRGEEQRALVERVLREVSKPVVLDADALNVLAEDTTALEGRTDRVITPHPAELGRLLQSSTEEVQKDRVRAVRTASERFGCVVVLKGSRSLIALGNNVYINPTGGPELASAGTGDVLTGAIAALLAASGDLAMMDRAAAAVYVHGLAGKLASRGSGDGVVAWDVAESLGRAREQARLG